MSTAEGAPLPAEAAGQPFVLTGRLTTEPPPSGGNPDAHETLAVQLSTIQLGNRVDTLMLMNPQAVVVDQVAFQPNQCGWDAPSRSADKRPPVRYGSGRSEHLRWGRRLLAAHDRLAVGAFERMLVLLEAGDPSGEVAAAYLAKELLREVYATTDVVRARQRLRRFYDHCRGAEITELSRLARTIRRWEPQLLAWHATGLTNGPPKR